MSNDKKIAARVIKSYQSGFSNPLILKKGERLKIRPKKTNFVGWVWCISTDGNSGWVPENFINITDNTCVMLVDYDATELSVSIGENLTILSEESDWVWCINCKNQKGWVPLENVRKL